MKVHELTLDAGAPLRRYVAHTAGIDPTLLRRCRDLLDIVFDGDLTEADWGHAVGGMHSIITDGDVVIGHASAVQRRLQHHSVVWRTGYVDSNLPRTHRQNGRALLRLVWRRRLVR